MDEWNVKEKLAKKIMQSGKKLSTFPVLYSGWECDDEAWLYEFEGKVYIISTDHCTAYVMSNKDVLKKIAEYESVLRQTKQALAKVLGET